MKKNVGIIFVFFAINLFACNGNTRSDGEATNKSFIKNNSKNKNIDVEQLSGEWMKDCNAGAGNIVILKTLDTALMEITFNQIQIDTKISINITDTNVVLLFKLIEPYDLGNGGIRLHWKDFSRDSVIAKMEIIDSANANLTWYGFYDNLLKIRTWIDGFDILPDDRTKNQTPIKKCQDFKFSDER